MTSIKTTYVYGAKWRNLRGELHREDGPAIELNSGSKCWYINDELHRLDGPAIMRHSGKMFWFIDNKTYSEYEYKIEMVKRNLNTLNI